MSLQFLTDSLTNENVKAFMLTIRKSEGTDAIDGYSYLFGSTPRNGLRFIDFADHPNIRRPFGDGFSTAAGAYQILYRTWVGIKSKYNLPDFTPPNQDIACAELISQQNSLQKIINGLFEESVLACNNIWASLPGSTYNQPIHKMADVEKWYLDYGGKM